MYKVKTQDLESIKKGLKANNRLLKTIVLGSENGARRMIAIEKQIEENEKQIKTLENEYYID